MIQLNELRVGNIVNVNYLEGGIKHCVLTADLLGDLLIGDTFNINIIDCYPIEITPEILEACGIELNEDLGDQQYYQMPNESNGYGVLIDHKELAFYSFKGDNVYTLIYDSEDFLYLHQLQNLIHALTGKELEIKQLAPL